MRVYARSLKVAEYFLFDPWSGVLEGYELDSPRGVYRRKELDSNGRLHCDQVGLRLGKAKSVLYGVEVEWLRWMEDDGRVLLVPEEVAKVAQKKANIAEEKANVAEEKANIAEEKANAAEEKANAEAARSDRLALEVEELRRRLEGR